MSVLNGPISRIMSIVGCSINRIKNRRDHVHVLVLYGLGIDTVNQSFFVPTEKVVELQEHIMRVQDKKKITVKQLQSLAGSPRHCQLEGLFPVVCMVSCLVHLSSIIL